ncbi:19617_t:CDS:2 [Entrophospora sp. SA101]|nr:19617_t:CDS:2 [Entrophospora sp. SA101]
MNRYYRSETYLPESNKFITDLVHKFLLSICCTPGVGICFQDEGWYPYGEVDNNDSFDLKNQLNKDTIIILLHQIFETNSTLETTRIIAENFRNLP